MKKFISIFSLVLVLAMTLSMVAFAAGSNEFTISTDVTSVAAGDTVIVTVDANGDWAEVAMVSLSIKFDADKFSATTSGRAPWCFDKTWYDTTKDGNPANLGYINTPSVGENPSGQLNVGYISTDGYTIDDGGDLYKGGETTIAKIKFTAKVDVDSIDSSCFELMDICKVEDGDGLHTLTLNQLASNEEDEDDVNVIVPTDVKDVTAATVGGEPTDYQIGSGLGMTVNTDATFTMMKWAITTEAGRLFSKTIALPNVTGEFKVAATFINGAHANEFGKDVVAPVEFSEVGAIFSDGTADYFTNEADAALKAE